MSGARIARFVKAARSLLLMQLAAAAIAVGLGVWAVVAVRDLASERDQLRGQVAELEARRPEAPAATPAPEAGPTPSPLDDEVRPPAILPVPIPVTETPREPVDGEPIDYPPPPPPPDPDTKTGEPDSPNGSTPGSGTPDSCVDARGNRVPCRPGRWTRPDSVLRRPIPPVRPEALRVREQRPQGQRPPG